MANLVKDEQQNLVAQAVAGDKRAFSELVRRQMNQIANLTYRMTGDRDTALDLAQETFVSAWENLGAYRSKASFSTWLYRIATNKCLNHIEKEKRRRDLVAQEMSAEPSRAPSPESKLHQQELSDGVAEFMASLPTQQRAIFELRFYQQLSFAEIAQATDRAVGTVKTGYREAIRKLRSHARSKEWSV